MAGD
jgi:hypothetical protein